MSEILYNSMTEKSLPEREREYLLVCFAEVVLLKLK